MEQIITNNKKTKNTNDLSDRRKTSSEKKRSQLKRAVGHLKPKPVIIVGPNLKKPITEHSAGDG